MRGVRQHTDINEAFWNEIAPHHAASAYYDLAAFRAGRSTLGEIETCELGDVAGREFVHLMCHIGLDTLSWARLGALVTGLDFSAEALRIAEEVAADTGLAARFVRADLLDAGRVLGRRYDVVFLSRGVLMWIADIDRWAAACAELLVPGGVFYLLDIHPIAMTIEHGNSGLSLAGSYFHSVDPTRVNSDGSYAVSNVGLHNNETREWIHPVGDVVTALVRAGIRVEFLHEFPADPPHDQLPALFSVRGTLD